MDITKAKTDMLVVAREAAHSYARLVGMTTTFVCHDGFRLPVRWESSNFAHLCGLDYYTDGRRVRRYPYATFYEHLIAGRRISIRQIAPSTDPRWLADKARVLVAAMDIENADAVVESGNSRIVFYAGTEVWCVGIGHDRENDYWFPQSLVRKSYEKAMRPGSVVHAVDRVEFDPTPVS